MFQNQGAPAGYDPNQQQYQQPLAPQMNYQQMPAQQMDPNQYQQQQPPQQYQQPQVGGQEYEKMTHVGHIRKRPDTYIGSQTGVTMDSVWVASVVGTDNIRITNLACHVATAIIGISKEVFDNATDNVERSRMAGIDPGIIETNMTENSLSIKNYGKHIPIVMHHKEKVWTPQMLFGELLTSDNYNDEDVIARYKIGRNGYGIKLTNIFSICFQIIIGDPVQHLKYTQMWTNGMLDKTEPVIEQYNGMGFTQITFVPDFSYFYEVQDPSKYAFLESMQGFYLNRTIEMSYAAQVITSFNGIALDYRDAKKFFQAHFEGIDPSRKQAHWISPDKKQEFFVADTPGKGFIHAFVNGTPVHQGEHVNEYIRVIFEELAAKFEKDHGKKVTVLHLKKHISIVLRVTLDKPSFDSQIKKKLIKPKPKIPTTNKDLKKIQKDVMKWDVDEELRKAFNMKSKKGPEDKKKHVRVAKVYEAVQASSGDFRERLKCTLILTEGETGCTLALEGAKYLPGGSDYCGVYPLRGKTMNIDRHGEEAVDANKELGDILKIIGAQRNVDYSLAENFRQLRYGKIAFMTDADYDGYHIQGLLIKFIFTVLRSIAPFDFSLAILTPVIEGFKSGQRIVFYTQKHFNKWCQVNEIAGWKFKYKKGLGSWNVNEKTLRQLFEQPIVITFAIDPTTDDILKLAFDKKMTEERKQWIAGYDPNSECILRTPRPITDFFQEEFRDYSKASVIRAIPRLMDGMKPVHRKVLYCLFKKFSKSGDKDLIKIPQFGGFVMEHAGYHHGEQALYATITIMAQHYVTGPNNITLVDSEGNTGKRRKRGADKSPARYLQCGLAPIARLIYHEDDEPLWEILYDDGKPVEPKEMYPIIPMALINKCEGIGSGWSTKIPCHDPRLIIEWVRQWIEEMKMKKGIPTDQLDIDITSKPELIPFWRDYKGTMVRIKNTPFEVFRNEGAFREQFHTIFVTELPAECSIDAYKIWGEKQQDTYLDPEKTTDAILRTFTMHPPGIDFRITGMSSPNLEKLNLIRTVSLSNMVLIAKDDVPKKFNYVFEILCEWCSDRLQIYEKRKAYMIGATEEKLKKITLKYMFVMDVVQGRLELRGKKKSEIIPYMQAKGYPYKSEKKNGKKLAETSFLDIPIGSITYERAEKLRKELGLVQAELDFYRQVWPEDLWLRDLAVLKPEIDKLYSKPLE